MPPRSNLALKQQDLRLPAFDFAGRRLKVVPPPQPPSALEEPSPMLEAIRRYLDALP
ncbi:MAG: hypothetical protein JNJ54_27715 [Myxococcaceae bacterium]|nr:hypothetical protein [Myxococcaceae bacterium]